MTAHIAFILNNMDIGGPQKGLLALLEILDKRVFQITIVSMQPGGQLRSHFSEYATIVDAPRLSYSLQLNRRTLPSDVMALLVSGGVRPLRPLARFLWAAITRQELNPHRQRVWSALGDRIPKHPELFDAAFSMSPGPATYFLVDGVDAVKKYHWIVGDYSQTQIDPDVDEKYFTATDGALAVSQQCADIFSELFPNIKHSPIPFKHLVPWQFYASQRSGETPGFDDAGGIKIITVSRLDPWKGIELAVEACRILRDRGLDVRWVVIGDGSERHQLQALVNKNKLNSVFRLDGFRMNVAEYLLAADILVHPSYSEGRSIAVDEAIAIGIPVVVTNYRTALSQVQDGVDGYVCDMSGTAIADKISLALALNTTKTDTIDDSEVANSLFTELSLHD